MKKITEALLKRAWKAGQQKIREIELARGVDGSGWMPLDERWKEIKGDYLPAMREVARVLMEQR